MFYENRRLRLLATALLFLASFQVGQVSQAQDDVRDILQGTNIIKKSQVAWQRFVCVAPETQAAVDYRLEKMIAKARQNGDTKEQIAAMEENERNFSEKTLEGYTHASTLRFIFDGKRILGDSIQLGFIPFGAEFLPSPSKNEAVHTVDYFDGENVVNMNTMGTLYPKEGVVSRDPTMNLKFTAPGMLLPQFLFGKPFDSSFAEDATVVERGENGILVRKKINEGAYKGYTCFLRINQKIRRPTEFFVTTGKQENKILHLETANWEQFGQIWFPRRIEVDLAPHQKGHSNIEKYHIVSASFNDGVDTSALEKAVVPGTALNDHRFSPRVGVRYTVRKKLPPDDAVLKMVQKREVDDKELEKRSRLTTARNIAFPSGALLMVGGLIWLRRSRRDKTQ